ncbi:MAG: 50S ribosomal protein L23 [Candidatus Liptonbacteria bacterium]|nr:50S ribosomal protein L23 [Candidatus Liptonbacteria bacterium]
MKTHFPLKKPWQTEKALSFTKEGKYVFIVQPNATKPEIRKAVERLYSVHVMQVNIVRRPAKQKRMGALRSMQGGHKKALITLRKGETIDFGK